MYSEYESTTPPRQNIVLVPTAKGETVAIHANGLSEPNQTISVGDMKMFTSIIKPEKTEKEEPPVEKTTDDYVFQFYLGSLTVVGLFILFRFIQKT